MISSFGTGVATTKDWLRATEDMKLTAYDPQCVLLQRSSPISIVFTDLEMRPARRSLGDKAREEMSDFEREYPW